MIVNDLYSCWMLHIYLRICTKISARKQWPAKSDQRVDPVDPPLESLIPGTVLLLQCRHFKVQTAAPLNTPRHEKPVELWKKFAQLFQLRIQRCDRCFDKRLDAPQPLRSFFRQTIGPWMCFLDTTWGSYNHNLRYPPVNSHNYGKSQSWRCKSTQNHYSPVRYGSLPAGTQHFCSYFASDLKSSGC